jgi:hypothetical protein
MTVQYPIHTGEEIDTAQACAERLSHHEAQLHHLVRLCDPRMVIDAGDATPLFTSALHQEARVALRRDYDFGDRPGLSVAQVLTQSALYGAYSELSPGPIPRSPRMRAEARKALRVIQRARAQVRQRRSGSSAVHTG